MGWPGQVYVLLQLTIYLNIGCYAARDVVQPRTEQLLLDKRAGQLRQLRQNPDVPALTHFGGLTMEGKVHGRPIASNGRIDRHQQYGRSICARQQIHACATGIT